MATNVTQKDKTLQEVIEWCKHQRDMCKQRESSNQYSDRERIWINGSRRGYNRVIKHCKSMLGYSGSMPLEVENQSEDARQEDADA